MTKEADKKVTPEQEKITERDRARGFTDADLAEALDNPEWTDEQLRAAKPFLEVFPHLSASARRLRNSGRS